MVSEFSCLGFRRLTSPTCLHLKLWEPAAQLLMQAIVFPWWIQTIFCLIYLLRPPFFDDTDYPKSSFPVSANHGSTSRYIVYRRFQPTPFYRHPLQTATFDIFCKCQTNKISYKHKNKRLTESYFFMFRSLQNNVI